MRGNCRTCGKRRELVWVHGWDSKGRPYSVGQCLECRANPRPIARLEVRNYSSIGGQETDCFTAEVWFDGLLRCTVRNAGHGGQHEYKWVGTWNPQVPPDIEAYVKAQPPLHTRWGTLTMDLDLCVSKACDEFVARRKR